MCLAVPGEILEVTGDEALMRQARVSFGGIIKNISLAFTPDAAPGSYVLVHAGVAIASVNQAEAGRILEALEQLVMPETDQERGDEVH